MKKAGQAMVHDGRLEARELVASAYEDYEAAAQLVDGLPILHVAEVKAGKLRERANDEVGRAAVGVIDVSCGCRASNLRCHASAQ
jgi:hypothetical protein